MTEVEMFGYDQICSCVNCERLFTCNPKRKTRLCVFCDTPQNNKLKWEGKLVFAPCEVESTDGTVLIINDKEVEVKKSS